MTSKSLHALESERQVIGSMLVDPAAIDVAADILSAEDFAEPRNASLWRTVMSLVGQGAAVDTATVVHQAESLGLRVDTGYVLGLTDVIPHVDNVETHARIVRDLSRLRGLVSVCSEILVDANARPDSIPDFLDAAESKLFTATSERHAEGGLEHVSHVAIRCYEHVRKVAETKGAINGLTTGLSDLDALLGGLRPGQLVIVAGRPGMGKTGVALRMAEANAHKGTPVAFFSLEMPSQELMNRSIAANAGIDLSAWINGRCDKASWEAANRYALRTKAFPWEFDDTAGLALNQLRARCRRFRSRYGGLGLVVVDYLQLMRSGLNLLSREQEIATISRGLKGLAKELSVPVVALSQLNRAVDGRTDKRPMLSDLRESGQVEQDADAVIFVYRDEVYNKDTDAKGVAELVVAKHRNGPTGSVEVAYVAHQTKFADLKRYSGDDFGDWNEGVA